jgi:hypothetical protein
MKEFRNVISKRDAWFTSSDQFQNQQNADIAHFEFQQSGSGTRP